MNNGTMWTAVWAFVAGIPTKIKVLAGVAALLVAFGGHLADGATLLKAADDLDALPARVELLEQNDRELAAELETLADTLRDVSRKADRMICLAEAAAGWHGYEQCAR